ncbi:IS3 family transposase [Candidatus Reidiella endopervernicosa]|uniref:IS3 family transposase n=1 Tax=Candidatus Reidiella endopervernicosa TaxID=2738883 RepID=A0A6N0HRW3_9GAMM|nr:IS3 family transposase [Candidatus Reidiella endopervernicosa]QKQ25159.1 IS3 family transposase [Candidatus Reidiella endopervernicosa]
MATVSCGRTSERYRFIQRNRKLGVKYMCEWLGVSRSGYYDWCKRPAAERTKEDAYLTRKIVKIHRQNRGVYGSPRIHQTLRNQGVRIGKKRVERLMRDNGVVGRVVKVTRRQPGLKRFKAEGENLKRLAPNPDKINQVWVGDVTYLKVKGAWRYLATVMDVFSRRIIGWSLGRDRTTNLTLKALRHALRDREPEKGMIFHTDRGIEYTAHRFRNELKGMKSDTV